MNRNPNCKSPLTKLTGLFLILSLHPKTSHATAPTRHYVIPNYNLKYMPKKMMPKIMSESGQFQLVQMDQNQIETLSSEIHKNKMTCGGFVDVEDEVIAKDFNLNSFNNMVAMGALKGRRDRGTWQAKYESQVRTSISRAQKSRYELLMKKFTDMPDRYAKTDSGVRAADWLADQAQTLATANGKVISIERVATGGTYKQPSILIKIQGSEPKLPAVVLGGHMDTYQNNKPGADDDASGAIAILEIFNSVVESKLQFKRDLYFAFYAAEESGLVGSKKVVKLFKSTKREVGGVLQFDMVGYRSPKDTKKMFFTRDYTHDALTEFTKKLAKTYLGMADQDLGDMTCDYACSDHASWNSGGIPVVYPFEADGDNWFRDIHTSADAMNVVNIDHAMNFVKLGVAFAVEMAEPSTP